MSSQLAEAGKAMFGAYRAATDAMSHAEYRAYKSARAMAFAREESERLLVVARAARRASVIADMLIFAKIAGTIVGCGILALAIVAVIEFGTAIAPFIRF